MSTKKLTVLFIAGFVLVFVATLMANLASDSIQERNAEARQQRLEVSIAQAKMLDVVLGTQIDSFMSDHAFTAEDMFLFGSALSLARPCTETGDCAFYGEWTGSSDYHTVPHIATIYASPTSTYRIIPIETQYVRNAGDYYNPRLIVYHISRGGTVTKVLEDGSVLQNWCAGWECDWYEIDDSNYARQIRRNALRALNQS